MPVCSECKHYKPVNDEIGDCFGHEVPANLDVEKCPAKAFTPK